jgi:triosephosphate isomerase
MRRPILAANWKMHKTTAEAAAFASAFLPLVEDAGDVDAVIAPPFTALESVGRALAGSSVALAAQNVNPEEKGAFTGEISPGMLAYLGCAYAIVGHSERRSLYGETDDFVARKARALLEIGIRPIVCVGESLEQRERPTWWWRTSPSGPSEPVAPQRPKWPRRCTPSSASGSARTSARGRTTCASSTVGR